MHVDCDKQSSDLPFSHYSIFGYDVFSGSHYLPFFPRGRSSFVYKAKHFENGLEVAIKAFLKNSLYNHPDVKKKIEKEIAIMRITDHPNIIQLYDVYETKTHIFLILEYAGGGTLLEYVNRMESLDVDEASALFSQLISGLSHCHEHNICHRDIKLENLLLSSDLQTLKIADFGLSSVVWKSKYFDSPCGSIHYSSPEILTSGNHYNGFKADIWACGVVLYTMLTGHFPFSGESVREIAESIKLSNAPLPRHIPWDVKDLIRGMLHCDYNRRFSMSKIQNHAWMKQSNYNFESCKILVPKEPILDVNIAVFEMMKALGYPKRYLDEQFTKEGINLEKILYAHISAPNHRLHGLMSSRERLELKHFRERSRFRSSSNPEIHVTSLQSYVPFSKEDFIKDITTRQIKKKIQPREEAKLPYMLDQFMDGSDVLLFKSDNGREMEVAQRGGRRKNRKSAKKEKDVQSPSIQRKRILTKV